MEKDELIKYLDKITEPKILVMYGYKITYEIPKRSTNLKRTNTALFKKVRETYFCLNLSQNGALSKSTLILFLVSFLTLIFSIV